MTILRVGSTNKYSQGWDHVFGKKKASKTAKAKRPAAKVAKKKKKASR